MVKNYSVDKGIRAPVYKTIKNFLYKEANKNLSEDIVDLSLASQDSLYYKTLRKDKFVIYIG